MQPDRDIRLLIESARHSDAALLYERCWPRGGDRTDAVAREWVRRWGPARASSLDWDSQPN